MYVRKAVLSGAVLAFAVPFCTGLMYRQKSAVKTEDQIRLDTARQLSVVPIRQLTAAEVVLNRTGCWATSNRPDLMERAEKAGPWAVLAMLPTGKALKLAQYAIRVAAGGMAINELVNGAVVEDAVLQEVTVSVEYGIGLETISPERIELGDKTVTLRLPPPSPVSTPRIDLDRSPTIDRQTKGDAQEAEWTRLQHLAFDDAQRNVAAWVRDAGLEAALREQSRAVVHECVQTLAGPDVTVRVVYDDEPKGGGQ
ncbi:MAG TPA: DUF4230 domain-containing protein [Phycisphaerae bacterium]|nr:DUF4230 domain-containing protein [Phycisphaerae bacterium]